MLSPPGLEAEQSPSTESSRDDPRLPPWKEMARRLDIDGHDIWVFIPDQTISDEETYEYTPARFGDRDPSPDGPDPDVWPLSEWDPGAPAPVEELTRVGGSFPVPHVAWVTEEYLDAIGRPDRVTLGYQDLPPWKRPDDMLPGETISVTPSGQPTMTLTKDRKEALRRIANFWNGNVVKNQHILLDKCPSWQAIIGDLPESALDRLYNDPTQDPAMVEAFRDHTWFESNASVFLKSQSILRKKVWYAPTLQAKTLINGRDDLPSLRGDPREGLLHRVTVGLVALHLDAHGLEVSTYEQVGDYVVDLVARDDNGSIHYIEVITSHNNWELHRSTYRKLADLRNEGDRTCIVFDTRKNAYRVFNHWLSSGLAELPTGSFDNNPRISWARKKIHEADADPDTDWIVSDWGTTDWVWRHTLGADGPGIDEETVTSLRW